MSPLSVAHIHHIHTSKDAAMLWNESTIILAVVGMVGLFSTAIIWQRANRITTKYYGKR